MTPAGTCYPAPVTRSPLRHLALLLLALVACGPVYETGYRFEPPEDAASPAVQQCLAACNASQAVCQASAQEDLRRCDEQASLRFSACQARAQLDFELCRGDARTTGETCIMPLCQRPACSTAAVDSCAAGYRRCFASCGGVVVEEQRCVSGCPS